MISMLRPSEETREKLPANVAESLLGFEVRIRKGTESGLSECMISHKRITNIPPDQFCYLMNMCSNNLRCDTTRGKCYQYQIFPTSAGMKKTFLPDGQVVRHINISKDEGIGIYMRIYGSKEELDLS